LSTTRPAFADAVLVVIGFYSRLPVPPARHVPALAEAVWAVPLAAVAVAAPAAGLLLLASLLGASSLFAATLAVAALVVVTGALHEDGLADCADGFWGGAARLRRLEIMRDSRIGTYGVLALVLAVLAKVALLAEAIEAGLATAALLLVAAAVAGRTVALYPWVGLPNAREDGLASAMGRPTTATFRRAVLLGLLVTVLLLAWRAPLGVLVAAGAAALSAKAVASLADRKIGGHTGDVIGAAVVLGDLTYLAAFTIWAT